MSIVFDSRYDDVDCFDDEQPDLHTEMQDLHGGDDYPEQWEVESWD